MYLRVKAREYDLTKMFEVDPKAEYGCDRGILPRWALPGEGRYIFLAT